MLADINAALGGDRAMAVLLCGPSGVGKTRLGEEYADRAVAAGRPVVRVVASRALAQIPLGALVTLLDAGDAGPTRMPGISSACSGTPGAWCRRLAGDGG